MENISKKYIVNNRVHGYNTLYNILDVYILVFFFFTHKLDRKIFWLFYSLLRKSRLLYLWPSTELARPLY